MDKLKTYQDAILDLLNEYAAVPYGNAPDLIKQVIADREGNHFQLMSVGWNKHQFACNIVFHFDIKEGKIWVQRNNTELMVGDELAARGVPKSDIVLGFKPPSARPDTGFGIA